MARAQAGDSAAYDAVLRAAEAWLRGYLGRRLAADSVADVTQEVLLTIHAKRHTYDPARPFGPWLASIARYKLMDRLRAVYAARGREDELDEEAGQGSTHSHEGAVLSALVVAELLGTLPPGQAEAVRLVKIDGCSVNEASVATGQSPSLVKVNVHRGLKRMLRRLEGGRD